jgi:hypothetical protein
MTQPQATTTPEPKEITLRIEVKLKLGANVANLTKLVEQTKPVIAEAQKLGTTEAHAMFGRQKLAIV